MQSSDLKERAHFPFNRLQTSFQKHKKTRLICPSWTASRHEAKEQDYVHTTLTRNTEKHGSVTNTKQRAVAVSFLLS